MSLLIKNAHIISPDLAIENGAIHVKHGEIIEVFSSNTHLPETGAVYDAERNYILPGFIDIHAHGADGKDVCDANLDSLQHIAHKKLQEGVTTWLPTTLSLPQDKLLKTASTFAEFIKNTEYNSHLKTPGLHIEGPFLNSNKAGAQNPNHLRDPDFSAIQEIHKIAPTLILSLAPCLEGATELISKASDLGIRTSAAHTQATYSQIQHAISAGLTHLTHFGNAMSALHHRDLGTTGAGLLHDKLMLELICDNIHLSKEFLSLVFKTKSIDQIMLITDSTAGSWMNDGSFTLGGLDVIVKNNEARLCKNNELAGSTLRYHEGFKNAITASELPLTQLVKTTSWNQAKSLGLSHLGKIEVGYRADLVVLDHDFEVLETFVEGYTKLS